MLVIWFLPYPYLNQTYSVCFSVSGRLMSLDWIIQIGQLETSLGNQNVGEERIRASTVRAQFMLLLGCWWLCSHTATILLGPPPVHFSSGSDNLSQSLSVPQSLTVVTATCHS